MTRTKIIVLVLILLTFALAAVAVILYQKRSVSSGDPTGQGTFPTGGSSTDGSPLRMRIPLAGGGFVDTLDFIHNDVTIEDPANVGVYYLVGSSGACRPDGSCPSAGGTGEYTILYYSQDHSFVIGLLDEPLGRIRREAERALMDALGLTEEQMCMLNYTIGTTAYVSEAYGGTNLGFSFCPGAVVLP